MNQIIVHLTGGESRTLIAPSSAPPAPPAGSAEEDSWYDQVIVPLCDQAGIDHLEVIGWR